MDRINLEEYKYYLVNNYRHECDNNENQRQQRMYLLNRKYNNEYLEDIIEGTHNFVNKIIEMSNNDYYGYLKIPLKDEPDIKYIDLHLVGGASSDIIISDSENNFYSLGLLNKIFGEFFYIEPCHTDFIDDIEEDDDFAILSEIPSYSLYIQCKKEIIDKVKNEKVLRITKK